MTDLSVILTKMYFKTSRLMAKRFRKLRNFVRHDGHFIASFTEFGNEAIDNDRFTAIYESIPTEDKKIFRDKFIHYRKLARSLYPDLWAELHRPLLDVSNLFETANDIYIVSGKDEESILYILSKYGLNIPANKIYGRMTDKTRLLPC